MGAPEPTGPWSDQVVAEPLMVSLPVVVRGDSAGGNHYRRGRPLDELCDRNLMAPYLKALRWSIGSLAPIPSLSDPLRVTLPPLGDTILRGVTM